MASRRQFRFRRFHWSSLPPGIIPKQSNNQHAHSGSFCLRNSQSAFRDTGPQTSTDVHLLSYGHDVLTPDFNCELSQPTGSEPETPCQLKMLARLPNTEAPMIRSTSRQLDFQNIRCLCARSRSWHDFSFGFLTPCFDPALSPSMPAKKTWTVPSEPGDDFYQYANGAWLAKAKHTCWPVELRYARNHGGKNEPARARTHSGSGGSLRQTWRAKKVGDYYASFMDEDRIEAKKLTPLADEMAAISAITNKTSLSAYLGTTLNGEVDGLIANSDHIFGLWINQGFEDTEHNVVHFRKVGSECRIATTISIPRPKWRRRALNTRRTSPRS